MSRSSKKAAPAVEVGDLVGEAALIRSSIWLNGQKKVAAIITDAVVEPGAMPSGAIALVTLTAFPPGAASRMFRDVPLYAVDGAAEELPAAWIKPRA